MDNRTTSTHALRIKGLQTQRKVLIATEFLAEAVVKRMKSKTWGQITVTVIVEEGFARDVILHDEVTLRDLPADQLELQLLPGLTETERKL